MRYQKYYQENKEARQEYGRKYYQENKEARQEYGRKYYQENKEARQEDGYVQIYSMGDTIKDWPRDLEAELRERSEVLFCGVALEIEIKHYRRWGVKSRIGVLKKIGNPKYIMIVDFKNPGPGNSPLLSDEVKIRNYDEYL